MSFVRNSLLLLFTLVLVKANAQDAVVYKPYLATVQLFQYNNQQGLPVYTLNSADRLQLEFDDLEGSLKNYYYTYVLCDYNWNPVNLNPFDYIKGFTQNRISTYRYSSIAFTKYTHYQAILPDPNAAVPTRSGNYLLKVFLNGNQEEVVFTKRMYVIEPKASIAAEVVQPFTPQYFSTHQKIKFTASIKGINTFSAAQQIKAVILQNNRWDNAQKDIPPTFVRGNVLEYNSENIAIFEAGKEWRWLDLRSFRLQSDRVQRAVYNKTSTDIYLKPDTDRRGERYVYFPDFNGMYSIMTSENINPLWQGDYAKVYFSFAPPNGVPYSNTQELYLFGGLTGYEIADRWQLRYNAETGMYETDNFLKQGYYNYSYVLKDLATNKLQQLDGNYWETENTYTILLYYKGFNDRSDQLIGISQINSRKDRPGFSF